MENFERKTVSSAAVMDAVRKAVATSPDYIYEPPYGEMCKYVHTDADGNKTAGCVIGHAFADLGIPLSELERHEGHSAGDVLFELFAVQDNASATQRFVTAAQDRQDNGRARWAEALEYAENYGPVGVIL